MFRALSLAAVLAVTGAAGISALPAHAQTASIGGQTVLVVTGPGTAPTLNPSCALGGALLYNPDTGQVVHC